MPSEIVRGYRQIYKAALRAVLYASPGRFQVRDSIRTGFRTRPVTAFSPRRIQNTVRFLERAQEHTGMEHKILKNLCFVRYWQNRGKPDLRLVCQQTDLALEARRNTWAQFDATLTMLNESLDLCLR